jgi:putative membrane protein
MLSNLSGSEFDKQYMSMMVKDHQEDVNKFQKASNTLADTDIKAFAAKTLPVLQTHLDKAQQINTSMEGSARSNQ